MDRPGGTIRVSPAWASSTSKAEPDGRCVAAAGVKRSRCSGPAAVHQRAGLRPAEDGGQVQQTGLVLGPDPHLAGVLGQQVGAERHGRGGAPTVGQRPRAAGGVRRGQHGQDRGDADAARDEQVAVRGL
jgi:hypothetical protein